MHAAKDLNVKNAYAALTRCLPVDKYSDLGLALGLQLIDIHKIERDFPNQCNRQLQEIIQTWINLSPSASWKTLAQKLVDIKLDAVASKIAILN